MRPEPLGRDVRDRVLETLTDDRWEPWLVLAGVLVGALVAGLALDAMFVK